MVINCRGLVEIGRPPFRSWPREIIASSSSGSSSYARSDFEDRGEAFFFAFIGFSRSEGDPRKHDRGIGEIEAAIQEGFRSFGGVEGNVP